MSRQTRRWPASTSQYSLSSGERSAARRPGGASGASGSIASLRALETVTAVTPAMTMTSPTHCDGEKPPRAECGSFCGGAATPARHGQFMHYGTAMLLAYVKGEAAAAAELTALALEANGALSEIVVDDAPPCPESSAQWFEPRGDSETEQVEDPPEDPSSDGEVDVACQAIPGAGTAGFGSGLLLIAIIWIFTRLRKDKM